MEPIELIGGGQFMPMDLEPFLDRSHRVDPASLPDLPAGITLADLTYTMWERFKQDQEDKTAKRLLAEIQVRTVGYLPAYDPDTGYDQFGYDQFDQDHEGRGRDGLTNEERNQDPADRGPQGQAAPIQKEVRYARHGGIDRRMYNKGIPKNKANMNGQIVRAVDGSDRTLDQVYFDLFANNECFPPVDRLTDDELLARLRELFPNRHFRQGGRQSDAVTYNRWRYNKGKLACQRGTLPAYPSHRYVRTDGIMLKTTVRGKCIERWDFTEVYKGGQMRRELNEQQNQQRQEPQNDEDHETLDHQHEP